MKHDICPKCKCLIDVVFGYFEKTGEKFYLAKCQNDCFNLKIKADTEQSAVSTFQAAIKYMGNISCSNKSSHSLPG